MKEKAFEEVSPEKDAGEILGSIERKTPLLSEDFFTRVRSFEEYLDEEPDPDPEVVVEYLDSIMRVSEDFHNNEWARKLLDERIGEGEPSLGEVLEGKEVLLKGVDLYIIRESEGKVPCDDGESYGDPEVV